MGFSAVCCPSGPEGRFFAQPLMIAKKGGNEMHWLVNGEGGLTAARVHGERGRCGGVPAGGVFPGRAGVGKTGAGSQAAGVLRHGAGPELRHVLHQAH